MGDFFCGSGGFITEYVRFLNHKYKNKIDWLTNVTSLYGCDTDRDIIKSALVDVLLLTECFTEMLEKTMSENKDFTMKGNIKRIGSTFDDEFNNEESLKVMYNFTNPPYGGDKGKKKDDKVNLNDATKSIKHIATTGSINKPILKDTQPYIIKGDNKETLALLHGMSVLEKNGIYCGVLKEGVFFDKKFKDLRKNLIENYEVLYVVSVPQSDFWNTSTKTSILIFKNSGKRTTEVNFCELKGTDNENVIEEVNPETNKVISEFKTDEYKFTAKDEGYLTVDYETLKDKDYSLNYKNYIEQDIQVNEGFKVVKLGDILEYLPKSKRKAGDANDEGLYRFYTSSDIIKKSKFIDYTDNLCLIIGTGGKCSLFLDKDFACSADNFVCITESEELTTYIYYYIKTNWNNFLNKLLSGSTLGHISKERLNEYEIPIPNDISTVKLYLDYLNPANESLQSLQSLQSQKERAICGLIKMLTSFGKDGVDWDEYRLGDIITLKAGKFNTKNMSNTGEYPFFNASINNPIGTHNEYCFDGDKYILFIKSGNVNANSVGNVLLVKGKIGAVPDTLKISTNYNYDYLYHYLKSNYNLVKSFAETSVGLGHISTEKFKNMKIRIIKPHIIAKYKLEEEFEFMDKLKNDISQTLKNQEDITKQMMKLVLSSEKTEKIKETEETEKAEELENTEENADLDELEKMEKELEDDINPKRKKGIVKIR
jgi:restriction endonuclease S subunit